MKLSIIIPCYNEAGNLPLIFTRLRAMLHDVPEVEVILVNNGSKDDSASVFAAELAKHPDARFKLVAVPVNQGYGHGILQGLAASTGEVLAWTHADMQTDPQDVLTAYDLYKSQGQAALVVKGKRKNRALPERFFTFAMQAVAWLALGVMLDDINAQPKLFSRDFYDQYVKNAAPADFSLDLFLLYTARKQNHTILTVPVFFAPRQHGEAKGGGSWPTKVKLMRRTFAYIFELRHQLKRTIKARFSVPR